jgi:ABC-2 type transport system ATP-binding protein
VRRSKLLQAIRCQGLSKRYGSIVALDSLDLNVEERVIFGFLGPNGAGKTTTLKILTGLAKPTSGKAWVAGEEVAHNSLALRSKIGYLPEEPAFYNWMTGREHLAYVGQLFGLPSDDIERRCDELLELVDLSRDASRRVGGYSRGMRQRLGIAQALMNKPSVLFLDEPCSALDPFGRAEVLQTLLRLKEQATTIFMSSHILADVERVCDVVGIIDKGKLVVESGVEVLRQRFAHPVFEVEFEEQATAFVKRLGSLPWVVGVESEDVSGLRVRVRDVARAKQELPKIIAESKLTLRQYQMVLPTLEEVFMELLGNRKNGG